MVEAAFVQSIADCRQAHEYQVRTAAQPHSQTTRQPRGRAAGHTTFVYSQSLSNSGYPMQCIGAAGCQEGPGAALSRPACAAAAACAR